MDDLVGRFSRSCGVREDGGAAAGVPEVRSWRRFACGEILAILQGTPIPFWDLPEAGMPNHYLIIDDDHVLVLDTWSAFAFMQEDNDTMAPSNCALVRQSPSASMFALVATRPIDLGEELVYNAQHYRIE